MGRAAQLLLDLDAWVEAHHGRNAPSVLADGRSGSETKDGDWWTVHREVRALARWCHAVIDLGDGLLERAHAGLDEARVTFDALGHHHSAALTMVPRIAVLALLSRHDEAASCAIEAKAILSRTGDLGAAARVSLNLGTLQVHRGAYMEGAHALREAAVLFARAGDSEHSVMADLSQADALSAMGHFDQAQQLYMRAQMRANVHGYAALEAMAEESQSVMHLGRGRFAEAIRGLEATRRRYDSLGMTQQVAVAEKLIADTYLELRLLPEAQALYDKVSMVLGSQDDLASVLAQRGRIFALQGRRSQASETLQGALALFDAQGLTLGVAEVAIAQAELALSGGMWDEAAAHARRASEAFQSACVEPGVLRSEVVLANAEARMALPSQARDRFERVLAAARLIGMPSTVARCLTGLGQIAITAGDEEAARSHFTEAIDISDAVRRALPADDLRCAFITDQLEPYEGQLRIALKQHARQTSSETSSWVLQCLDAMRARSLADRAATDRRIQLDEETKKLRERLEWLYHQLDRDLEGKEASAVLRKEVTAAEQDLLERHRRQRLGLAGDQAATLIDDVSPGGASNTLDVVELQKTLGQEKALIEFGLVEGRWWACVVREDLIQVHALAGDAEVQQAVAALQFQLDAVASGNQVIQQHAALLYGRVRRRLQQLEELIFAPLVPNLSDVSQLVIVPGGLLAKVPFAALHDGDSFLCERMEVAWAPSLRMYLHLRRRRSQATPSAVVAIGDTHRLASAGEEARLVGSTFPGSGILVGNDARMEALRCHSGSIDLLHLACHAEFRSDNPRFSALHLSDGRLMVEDIEALDLHGATVVLSACNTGRTQQGAGEEMLGLVRAFLVAGASHVVASLWPLQDQRALEFMRFFYAAMARGRGCASALREAQTAVLAQQHHPFDWGTFLVYGDI
jgi:CHAT domain-containing protein